MKTNTIPKKVAERYRKEVHEASERHLWAMSNLRPTTTGVDGAVIWVSVGEFAGSDLQHGARIKVVVGTKITRDGLRDAISVRLTDPPEVLGSLPGRIQKQVVAFVNRNRAALLSHWNGEIDAKEMLDQLEKV